MRKVLSLVFLLGVSPSALLAKSAMEMVDQYTDILENKRYLLSDAVVEDYAKALRDLIFNGKTHAAKSEDGFAPIDNKDYGFRTGITPDERARLTKALYILALAVPKKAVAVNKMIRSAESRDISESLGAGVRKKDVEAHGKEALEIYSTVAKMEDVRDGVMVVLNMQPDGGETYKDIIAKLKRDDFVEGSTITSLLKKAYEPDFPAFWALEVLERHYTTRQFFENKVGATLGLDGDWDSVRQKILKKLREKPPEKKEFVAAAKEAAQLVQDKHGDNFFYKDIIQDLKAATSSSDISQALMFMLLRACSDGDKTTLDALTILAQSPEGLAQINAYLTKMIPYNKWIYRLKDKTWSEVKEETLFKQTNHQINNILKADKNTEIYSSYSAQTAEGIAKNLISLIYKTPGTTVLESLKKLYDLKDGKTAIETALRGHTVPDALKGKTAEQALEILDRQIKQWEEDVKHAIDSLKENLFNEKTSYYTNIVKYLNNPKSNIKSPIEWLLADAYNKNNKGSFSALQYLADHPLGLNIINAYLKTQHDVMLLNNKTWEQAKTIITEKQKKAGS